MFSVLRKDLRTSTAEGMAASVMVGVGETYLPVFVLALSGSQMACGLVSYRAAGDRGRLAARARRG